MRVSRYRMYMQLRYITNACKHCTMPATWNPCDTMTYACVYNTCVMKPESRHHIFIITLAGPLCFLNWVPRDVRSDALRLAIESELNDFKQKLVSARGKLQKMVDNQSVSCVMVKLIKLCKYTACYTCRTRYQV